MTVSQFQKQVLHCMYISHNQD